ncbi:MAG: LPS-assembly protein LptD [Candidatus Omnitrophica bacterium]|nr:LPS-assembly protein LptD [Candidatus Omnitrophota bacterium]
MNKIEDSPSASPAAVFLLVLVFSFYSLVPLFAASDLPKEEEGRAPVQVHGDTVEYFHEEEKVVGTGHVSIDYEGATLTADKVTVYMKTKLAVAEGNVVLTQKGSVYKGSRAEYNFEKKAGNVSGMDGFIDPSFYGKAQKIEKISEGHYRATGGYVTTCCGDSPFYKIQAQQVDIYPEKKVVIKNALVLVKGVPIFYIPYYVQPLFDFERFPVQVVPGKNQEWGSFILSKWRYNLMDTPAVKSRGNILLDYRARRSVGVGVENYYRTDALGRGAFKFYSAEDREPPDGVETPRDRTQWRHQAALGESTTLITEINKLSDATVIKDFFFREEYEKNAFPDNYASLITARPEYTFSVLHRQRFDDFFSVVERAPELRFDTHNRQFAETPFYLRQEVQFSNLKKQFANSDEGLDTLRLDANHTLTYAGHLGAVSVAPHLGTRQTYYSREIVGDRSLWRGTFDPGVDLSTRFYRVYDVYVKKFGLDYNQLRHTFTPTVSYDWRPSPTVSRTLLQQFDALDAIDKRNILRFNFENKLHAKEHAKDGTLVARQIARIIPSFGVDLHTGRLEDVAIDAELRPYSWLGLEADATYDAQAHDVDTANFDFYLGKTENFRLAVGQRYVQDQSSQTTGQVNWRLSPDLEIKVYERYEFQTRESKEFEFMISRAFSCVIVDFTYNHGDGDTFYFVFRLKGFPKASFSLNQSYNRPKSDDPTRPSMFSI